MRALLLLAAAVLIPAPALAHDGESDTGRLAEELRDPARQEQIAAVAGAMAATMLDTPDAPLLRAARELAGEDPEAIDPDLRVGDVLGPEAAEVPYEYAERLPQMMGAMAGLAVALEGMLPQWREAIERASRSAYETE